MHSHLITFTGPITTTYSQIAPNLIPSPDCSPEPKVGNTGPLAQPPKYIPGASPAFLQNPRPPECPGSEQSPSPTPPPQLQKPEARTFPPESLVGQVGHFQVLFPQAPSTILVAQPQPSFLGVLHAGFPGSLGRLGRGRGGGVSAEVSSHCPHSSFSSPLLLQDANPSTRPGGAQPLPPLSIHRLSRPLLSVHLSRYTRLLSVLQRTTCLQASYSRCPHLGCSESSPRHPPGGPAFSCLAIPPV